MCHVLTTLAKLIFNCRCIKLTNLVYFQQQLRNVIPEVISHRHCELLIFSPTQQWLFHRSNANKNKILRCWTRYAILPPISIFSLCESSQVASCFLICPIVFIQISWGSFPYSQSLHTHLSFMWHLIIIDTQDRCLHIFLSTVHHISYSLYIKSISV